MKQLSYTTRMHHYLLCSTGAAVLAFASAPALQAQQPLLSAATRSPMHRVAAAGLASEALPAPEPPSGQSNTAPIKDDLFAGTEKFAKNATEANEVDMDPDSLNMVNGPDAHRAHRTLLNVVHHYEYDKPGMYNMADVEEFRRKIEGPDWHCSVHSRELKTGESTDICSRRRAPDLIEQAIITVEPKELTFIHQIRKANGEGGSLDVDTPGMSMLDGLPPQATMAALGPMMKAEMLASTAGFRAEMPALMASLSTLETHGRNGSVEALKSMKNYHFQFTPEQERQLRELRKGLHSSMRPPFPPAPPRPPVAPSGPSVVPPQPPVPPVPLVPSMTAPTPDVPAAPSAPAAPFVPGPSGAV